MEALSKIVAYYNVGYHFISFRFEFHEVGFRPQWVHLSTLCPSDFLSPPKPQLQKEGLSHRLVLLSENSLILTF